MSSEQLSRWRLTCVLLAITSAIGIAFIVATASCGTRCDVLTTRELAP